MLNGATERLQTNIFLNTLAKAQTWPLLSWRGLTGNLQIWINQQLLK